MYLLNHVTQWILYLLLIPSLEDSNAVTNTQAQAVQRANCSYNLLICMFNFCSKKRTGNNFSTSKFNFLFKEGSQGNVLYIHNTTYNQEAYQFIKLYLKPSYTSLDLFTERLSQKFASLKVSNCLLTSHLSLLHSLTHFFSLICSAPVLQGCRQQSQSSLVFILQ